MKSLKKEIKIAKEISNKALNKWLKTNKQSDYIFYKMNYEYLKGLLKAKELIEGE